MRKTSYWLFKKLHLALTIATFGGLLWHSFQVTTSYSSFVWIAIYLYSGLGLISLLLQLIAFLRHGYAQVLTAEPIADAIRLRLRTKHSIKPRPGNYFHIIFPHMPLRRRLEGRLIPVTWWEPTARDSVRDFTLLIHEMGPENRIYRNTHVLLNGPYGKDLFPGSFEIIILVVDGISIAGILPFAVSPLSR